MMKSLKLCLAVAIGLLAACQQQSLNNTPTEVSVIKYDSTLAAQLGADDYGMKKYVMALLKKGPNRSHDSATASIIQRGHLDNIQKMASEGKLVLAGPFLDDGEIRGIYVFNVETIEEAEKLTAEDPAIKSGRLSMELHPWYGSAALNQLNDLSKRITKKSI